MVSPEFIRQGILRPLAVPWRGERGVTLTVEEELLSADICFGGSYLETQHRLIAIVLSLPFAIRIMRLRAGREFEDAFDRSRIPGMSCLPHDVDGYLRARRRLWEETGLSPDCGVYEVEDSEWIKSSQSEQSASLLTHVVVPDDNFYVEALVKSFRWEDRGPLPSGWIAAAHPALPPLREQEARKRDNNLKTRENNNP